MRQFFRSFDVVLVAIALETLEYEATGGEAISFRYRDFENGVDR